MILGPVNYIVVDEQNAVGAPAGVYLHAREVAAWLRDNDLAEPADDIETFVAETET